MEIKTLVFVYNATADHLSVFKDFFHKIFAPKTYPCNLCRLAFGAFAMKDEWKEFLDSLPYQKQFLHNDEFVKKYSLAYSGYPVIFASNATNIWVLMPEEEINNCTTLQQLNALIKAKLVSK